MIVGGIDVGGKNVHLIIIKDGEILAKGNSPTGIQKAEAAKRLYGEVLEQVGLKKEDIGRVVATGSASKRAAFAQGMIPDAAADARGVIRLVPSARTIIDAGAEEGRAIKISAEGKVLDFAINEKCAAGTGRGMEVFADLIRVPVWDVGPRSYKIKEEPPMISSTCVVFAKTEVVGLLEEGTPENDIMAAYCAAMAHRIMELLNRLGVKEKFVITGGIAKNEGVVNRLEKELGMKTAEKVWPKPEYNSHPFDTQIAGGLGAALFADAMLTRGKVKSVRKA